MNAKQALEQFIQNNKQRHDRNERNAETVRLIEDFAEKSGGVDIHKFTSGEDTYRVCLGVGGQYFAPTLLEALRKAKEAT